MNIRFNASNIFFKYYGYKVVLDPLAGGGGGITNWNALQPYKQEDAINIYALASNNGGSTQNFNSILGGTEMAIDQTVLAKSSYYFLEEILIKNIKAIDPELFDKLQSQHYHIIKKETDSGYMEQKIIYKN